MKFFLPLLLIFSSLSLFAQREAAPKPKPANESPAQPPTQAPAESYHQLRTKLTRPSHGLVKIQALIKKIKYNSEDDLDALDKKTYESLTLREKFTYTMIHAESYSQNCDGTPRIPGESMKIFSHIPDAFDEYQWSDRQITFLATNRDSVIAFMKESITKSKRVGINYKEAILQINAKEMIPFLIEIYKANKITKDLDILTLCLQMMKENEHPAFIATGMYRKLYSEESSYWSFLNYNKANEDLVIKRAMDFYNAKAQ